MSARWISMGLIIHQDSQKKFESLFKKTTPVRIEVSNLKTKFHFKTILGWSYPSSKHWMCWFEKDEKETILKLLQKNDIKYIKYANNFRKDKNTYLITFL